MDKKTDRLQDALNCLDGEVCTVSRARDLLTILSDTFEGDMILLRKYSEEGDSRAEYFLNRFELSDSLITTILLEVTDSAERIRDAVEEAYKTLA